MTVTPLPPGDDLFRSILDALPSPVFVVDDDVTVVAANHAARGLAAAAPGQILHSRAGSVLDCVHASESPRGCGGSTHCKDCVIRNAVAASSAGRSVVRSRHMVNRTGPDGRRTTVHLLVTAAPVHVLDGDYTLLVLEDVTELMELRSLVPICAYCKKIRTDDRMWEQIESYMHRHHDLDFSHGICPDCMKKQMREIEEARTKRGGTDPSSH